MLGAFEKAIKKFEAEYVPTIQEVIPQFFILQTILQGEEDDIELVRKLKSLLLKELHAKYRPNISMRHKMGLLLWPKFKSLSLLSAAEREEVSKFLFKFSLYNAL